MGKPHRPKAKPRPATIAVVGADGSGKTSIANAMLANGFVPIKYLYMGPAIGSSNHALPTSRLIHWLRRRSAGSLLPESAGMPPQELMSEQLQKRLRRGPILKTLGLLNRVAEEWYRQLLAWIYRLQGYSVLCDRHYLFEYCPNSASNRKPAAQLSERLHNWLLAKCYPEPDLVIFLDAPATVLHARKPEWTADYLNRQRTRILEQGACTRHFAIVDAEQPLATVQEAVLEKLRGAVEQSSPLLRTQPQTD